MVFDTNLSEDIPLSKILDCFIIEEEDPKVIINFLDSHYSDIEDILKFSDYSERLFQLDFIEKCSYPQLLFFVKMIKGHAISREDTNRFLWQIFQTDLSDNIKNLFRPHLNLTIRDKHPYTGIIGKDIQRLDICFKHQNTDIIEIAEKINKVDDNLFNNYIRYVGLSLWRNRICQLDFFLHLNVQKQYILLKNVLENYINLSTIKFVKQILSCNEIDSSIKEMIYSHRTNYDFFEVMYSYITKLLDNETINMLADINNFPELMMRVGLIGSDFIGEQMVFLLFFKGKIEMLKQWYEYDPEEIKKYLDITNWLKTKIND